MFVDTKAKVASGGEALLPQLVFEDLQRGEKGASRRQLSHLEATLEDLLSLGASHGAADSNLFVTTNAEGADGVASLGEDGSLTSELLNNLCGTGKPVTRLSHADVDAQLLNLKLLHYILLLAIVAGVLVGA